MKQNLHNIFYPFITFRRIAGIISLKYFTVIIFLLFGYSRLHAQLIVTTGTAPAQLVQNVLLGVGATVSGVSYSGSPHSIGYFSGGNGTNLGLKSGIIMSTGYVDGYNSYPPIGSPVTLNASQDIGGGSDYDLLQYSAGNACQDATVLQFDFVPLSDTIRFRYIFASEEYPRYVCSKYNDVFAFFISGPDPAGGSYVKKNIALIPGTALPVSINSVNNGSVGASGELINCTSLAYSYYFVDNNAQSGATIIFNGFTVVFTAWCVVKPCEKYHLKLAIADITDGIYDSAVFLEEGSFSASGTAVIPTSTDYTIATDTSSVEGCTDNILTFYRSGDLSVPLVIPIVVSGSAINGTDYVQLPDFVTFPAGQNTTTLIVDPIYDGITEGVEQVIVTVPLNIPCSAYEPKVIINIHDPDSIALSLRNDTTVICPVTFNIDAGATGGDGPLSYIWSDGLGTGSSITVTPFATTTYSVTVTDACGIQQATDAFTVYMPLYNPLQINTSPDPVICEGDTVNISVSVNGGLGNYLYAWSDGSGTGNNISVSPSQTTTYTISVTDSCGIVVTADITVDVQNVQAAFSYSYQAVNIVNFTNNSVNDSCSHWDFGDMHFSDLENPVHTFADTGIHIITLVVRNAAGCTDSVKVPLMIYPQFDIFTPNAFTPDDDGMNDYFAPIVCGMIKSEMIIFDRWGKMIFKTSELKPKWNGLNSEGNRAPLGAYVYLMNFETPLGEKHQRRGLVTVLR